MRMSIIALVVVVNVVVIAALAVFLEQEESDRQADGKDTFLTNIKSQ